MVTFLGKNICIKNRFIFVTKKNEKNVFLLF